MIEAVNKLKEQVDKIKDKTKENPKYQTSENIQDIKVSNDNFVSTELIPQSDTPYTEPEPISMEEINQLKADVANMEKMVDRIEQVLDVLIKEMGEMRRAGDESAKMLEDIKRRYFE